MRDLVLVAQLAAKASSPHSLYHEGSCSFAKETWSRGSIACCRIYLPSSQQFDESIFSNDLFL